MGTLNPKTFESGGEFCRVNGSLSNPDIFFRVRSFEFEEETKYKN